MAEHLLHDPAQIAQRVAARNRIIAGMSHAVIIPEARFKQKGWGTAYQVEFGIRAGRPVIIVKPRTDEGDVLKAFDFFKSKGAHTAGSPEEAVQPAEKLAGI